MDLPEITKTDNPHTLRRERSLMCDEGAVHWHGQAGLNGKGIGKNTDILKQVQPAVSLLRKVIRCFLFFGDVRSFVNATFRRPLVLVGGPGGCSR